MSTLIRVILDEGTANFKYIKHGECWFIPSVRFPEDGIIIGRKPIFSSLDHDLPYVDLAPCDLYGPQNSDGTPGWRYQMYYSNDFPGKPLPWSFVLFSTDGDEQRLSTLLAAPTALPMRMSSDKNYTTEFGADTQVSIAHNLGKRPAVTVIDSAGDEVDCPVNHVDDNTLILYFSAATGGTVTCN